MSESQMPECLTGDRYWVRQITVPAFSGELCYCGNAYVETQGFFGNSYTPLLSWQRSITINPGETKSLWLEYEKEGSVDLLLTLRLCQNGTPDTFIREWRVDPSGDEPFLVEAGESGGYISINLAARGKGTLRTGTLHARDTFPDGRCLLRGARRVVTGKRQEIFSYFSPGDRKPPLVVRFHHYRSTEKFVIPEDLEAAHIPYLLFLDPRLEGGAFYLGEEDYERAIENRITKAMKALHFNEEDLVFTGETMGAYGALYYASRFRPGAILLTTPIASLGTVARNERTDHPGMLETALDILRIETGGTDQEHADTLDQRMWKRVESASFEDTTIAVSRMLQDDYDPMAYDHLVDALQDRDICLYSKAFSGRHDTQKKDVRGWLQLQLAGILEEKYGRSLL